MKFVHTSKKPASDDNLIPLINVVFLMLIFFMVAGQISASDRFDVKLPISDNTHVNNEQSIKLLIDNHGKIALNQKSITLETLPIELEQTLQPLFRSADKNTIEPSVNIKADANVSAESLYQIFAVLKASGINKVTLLTTRG